MVNSVKSSSMDYNSWVASLNARGIKTTSLGKSEANFSDYTSALSESLKQEIAASFDCQADYDLQAKLASLFGSKSVLQSGDIVSKAKAAGIQVKVQYVPTTYIVDNKKGGQYLNNKNATQGSIAVYTFSDGNGGEIKIADANGNGALETEEIFMNEILTDVVSDIKPGGLTSTDGASATQSAMVDETAALRQQWEALKAEQQKLIEEQLAQFQQDFKPENNSKTTSSTSKMKSLAADKIKDKHPELSDEEIESYIDEVVSKAHSQGISLSKAVDLILDKPEEKQAKEA